MANKVEICGINTSLLPKLKYKEIYEILKKVKQGDEFARDQFVIINLRLVLSIVNRFSNKKNNSDDLFQVGCVGLIKAIDNFDMGLDIKFSTYAVPMIIGEIKRYLRDSNSVKVSRSLRDIAYKALQAKEELNKVNFKEPSLDEIAEKIEIDSSSVMFALDAISETVSLNEPIFNDDSDTIRLMDQISDTKNCDDDWIENLVLQEGLTKLNEKEKQILMLRYYIGKTQMEVSEEVGISQAQVSRLEKNALDVLRKSFA